MLTVSALKAFGADTDEGVARCIGKESFYLMLVKKAATDANFASLTAAIEKNDLTAAFEAAHALKGILSNLALTPILTPVQEITELLRARSEMDYQPYLQEIAQKKAELDALCAED